MPTFRKGIYTTSVTLDEDTYFKGQKMRHDVYHTNLSAYVRMLIHKDYQRHEDEERERARNRR